MASGNLFNFKLLATKTNQIWMNRFKVQALLTYEILKVQF